MIFSPTIIYSSIENPAKVQSKLLMQHKSGIIFQLLRLLYRSCSQVLSFVSKSGAEFSLNWACFSVLTKTSRSSYSNATNCYVTTFSAGMVWKAGMTLCFKTLFCVEFVVCLQLVFLVVNFQVIIAWVMLFIWPVKRFSFLNYAQQKCQYRHSPTVCRQACSFCNTTFLFT